MVSQQPITRLAALYRSGGNGVVKTKEEDEKSQHHTLQNSMDSQRKVLLLTLIILQVTVSVEVEGGRVVTATIREGAPVITVMFQVAKVAGLTLVPTSSLFEISPRLKLR